MFLLEFSRRDGTERNIELMQEEEKKAQETILLLFHLVFRNSASTSVPLGQKQKESWHETKIV